MFGNFFEKLIKNKDKKYFEHYRIKENDLKTLCEGIDLLTQHQLIEEEVLENIRIATYDSEYLYVITRGEHRSNDKFYVDELKSFSKTGLRVFRIKHSGFIGNKKEDYRGAKAWLLYDGIETTAVNAKKFPNENILYQPDLPQPKEILDAVRIPPQYPFYKIHKKRFDYLTDLIFHEVGHIEYRRLRNWQEGERITEFPSEEKRQLFLSCIRRTKLFPPWAIELIIENINKNTISEMYAMLVDREAQKRFRPRNFERENKEFERRLVSLRIENNEDIEKIKSLLKSPHITGRLLVRILEEQFPDFSERKKFVMSILDRRRNNEK